MSVVVHNFECADCLHRRHIDVSCCALIAAVGGILICCLLLLLCIYVSI